MNKIQRNSTWKNGKVPRGKHHNQTKTKTTVSLYLNRKLVERAKNRRLNLSRVTEQALSSILDYLEPQTNQESSNFTYQGSAPKNIEWAGPDLNRGPSARQADVLTKLDDRPFSFLKRTIGSLSLRSNIIRTYLDPLSSKVIYSTQSKPEQNPFWSSSIVECSM